MFLALLLAAAPAFLSPQSTATPAPSFPIGHQPVDCVVAGKHPSLTASLPPEIDVATARVFFQGASQEWYSVAMKAEGSTFVGVLPAPKKSLKEFHYYIEVTSRSLATSRTADRSTKVVASPGECRGLVAASVMSTASILVQGPAGAAAVPAGFAPAGLVAAGGGISATTVAIGAVVVGGGAIAATQLAGDNASGADVAYAGPFSADLTYNLPNGCRFVEQKTMTFTVEIPQSGSGQGQYGMDGAGRAVVVSVSNCPGVATGTANPFGINGGTFSASGSTVAISETSNPSASITRTFSFQGTLTGSSIQGTATLTERASDNGVTATATVPLTLNRR